MVHQKQYKMDELPLNMMNFHQLDVFETNEQFRKDFADWVRNYFHQGKPESKEILKTMMSAYIDKSIVESIITKRQLYFYIRAMEYQSADIIDRYIRAMKFKHDGSLDFERTSNTMLSSFDIEEYRKETLHQDRKKVFTEIFNPKQIETLLKFTPKDLIIAKELTSKSKSKTFTQVGAKRLRTELNPTPNDLNEEEINHLETLSIEVLEFVEGITDDQLKWIRENSQILMKFSTLRESEREIIINFDKEPKKWISSLSVDGKILLFLIYGPPIQALMAQIIWSDRSLNGFKLWFEGMNIKPMTWSDKLMTARLLSLAMVSRGYDKFEEIAEWLRATEQSSFFYYLRILQYFGTTEIRQKIRLDRFPVLEDSIFNLNTPEDLHFFTWILENFDPIAETNLHRIVRWTMMKSQDVSLFEIMRNRLRLYEYELTRRIILSGTADYAWLTEILTTDDLFKLLIFYNIGDPLPLLSHLKDDQFNKLFHENPKSLLKLFISMGRDDILELFNRRIPDYKNFVSHNLLEMFTAFATSTKFIPFNAYIKVLNHFSEIDTELHRTMALFCIREIEKLHPGDYEMMYRLFDAVDNQKNLLTEELKQSSPDLFTRLARRSKRSCEKRFKRGVDYVCLDSENKVTNPEELHEVLSEAINKGAARVGFIYTLFLIGKHIANGNVKALGYDSLNLWVMPKLGDVIAGSIIQAGFKFNSKFMTNGAPVIGKIVGNFAAFLGLYESIKEYKNATDTVDKKIADLHIITNSVYIIADLPAVFTGVMSGFGCQVGIIGAYAGPVGFAISVGILVLADFIESAYQLQKISKQIKLTKDEKSHSYWRNFFGRGIDEYLKRDIQAKHVYELYVQKILESFGDKYGKIVISLPDILVVQQEYVHKSGSNFIMNLWFRSFPFCMGEKKIIHFELDFNSSLTSNTPMSKNLLLESRIIPNNFNGYHLETTSHYDDVYVRYINQTILPMPLSEKCLLMRLETVMNIQETVEKWYFPQNLVTYEKLNNALPTLYFISALEFKRKFSPHQITDLYFFGNRINVVDSTVVENQYYFSKELIDCKIEKAGRNYLYVLNNHFNCQLIGNNVVFGSENSERFNISYASHLDGRGGNDTIIAHNNTIVRSYWGDSIRGKTVTILPLNVNEINKLFYDNEFIVYNNDNQTIKINDKSTLKTLDLFTLNPIKLKRGTVTDLHLHKIIQDKVILEKQLSELRNISNPNFKMVKQLSSLNYEIIIGDTGNNIFYPNTQEESMNFYWEGNTGTRHVYLLDEINANITISRANGLLDFRLIKNARNETVIKESGDITIVHRRLRLKILNNYENVTFGMDGKYYKLRNGALEEDHCTHPLRVTGRKQMELSHSKNYYNCLDFQSDNALFFKSGSDLILQSGSDSLLIPNYDSNKFDLSLRLSQGILAPSEFRDRVNFPDNLMLYKIDKKFVDIYHNQPINNNDIGVIDISGKSLLKFNGKIQGNDLHLKYKDTESIIIYNWLIAPEVRRIIFIFKEFVIGSAQCIVGNCEPEHVLEEFTIHKDKIELRNKREITDQFCINNVTLAYHLFQHYLDQKYPLPKFSIAQEDYRMEAYDIVEKFQQILKIATQMTGIQVGKIDCFDFYMNVVEELKNERYSCIFDMFYSALESIVPENKVFLDTLKEIIVERIEKY